LFANVAPGRISHRRETGQRRCASVRIFTGPEIWSNGSSTRSSTVGVWQPAMTSSRPTTSHLSSLHQYGCGCALMSPRPNHYPLPWFLASHAWWQLILGAMFLLLVLIWLW